MVSIFLFAFILILLGIGLGIAQTRNGAAALGQRPRRIRSLTTSLNPKEAVKTILHFAQQDGYKIPAVDLENDQLVLEEPTSAKNWGFFFPVIVSQQDDGATLVEVGIKSKLYQFGPIVTRSHEKCVNGIQAAFLQDHDVKAIAG